MAKIILNEYDWTEQVIEGHELGKAPNETLGRVARYYYENKYSKGDIRQMLETFLLMCDPTASVSKWSDTLDWAARNSDRHPLSRVEGVSVSADELAVVDSLQGTQMRRLAFALLCVAKYWDAVSEANDHWVNTEDKDVMRMANISTSIKRQSLMFSQLRDLGLVRFARKTDNLNVRVQFMTDGGGEAMRIDDFRNLGYQYLMHRGGPYFRCVNCGMTVKMNEPSKGRKQKYCPACAIELHTRQKVDSVMRRRQAEKESKGGVMSGQAVV